MIFRFNRAQLGAGLEKSLNTLLAEIQKTQKEEIEIIADEFPYEFIVKAANVGEAKISWDADAGSYKFIGVPLPASQPESTATVKNVGEIKDWQRPTVKGKEQPAQAPEPAPEPSPQIKVTVDSVVSQFMGLSPEQRTKFFCEAWRSISEEK